MADQKPFVIFRMRINITEEMMAFAKFQADRLRFSDAEDYFGALLNTALAKDWDDFEQWIQEENPDLLVENELIRLGYLAKDFWQRQPPPVPRERSELDDDNIPF